MATNLTKQPNLQDQTLFENLKHLDENQVEFWYARELQIALGYPRFDSFKRLILKTITDFENLQIPFHNDVELLKIEQNNPNPKEDYKFSRFFCYKLAMLGNTTECIIARTYFAVQTRKQELAQQNTNLEERRKLRKLSKESYKSYNSTLIDSGINEGQIGIITAMGDKALFGSKTAKIKSDNNIPDDRPLEDFLHPANVTARMLGREMTKLKAESDGIKTLGNAIGTHTKHNKEIRQVLVDNQITPEELPILEDLKGQLKLKSKESKTLK